jgi:hypothetical protein
MKLRWALVGFAEVRKGERTASTAVAPGGSAERHVINALHHSGLEVEQGQEHEELSLRKSFTYNLLLGLQEPWRTKTLHA